MKLRLMNRRLMQVNINLHLIYGISYIQVINLSLIMQITQINQENQCLSTKMNQRT